MPEDLVFTTRLAQYTESMFENDKRVPLVMLKMALQVLREGPSLQGITYALIDPKNLYLAHYPSSRTKRVCISALAAELLAMGDGFDVVFSIRKSIENLFLRKVSLTMVTD